MKKLNSMTNVMIKESKDFGWIVRENDTYEEAISKMNDKQKQVLNTILIFIYVPLEINHKVGHYTINDCYDDFKNYMHELHDEVTYIPERRSGKGDYNDVFGKLLLSI
jgi:hypothetical protein